MYIYSYVNKDYDKIERMKLLRCDNYQITLEEILPIYSFIISI